MEKHGLTFLNGKMRPEYYVWDAMKQRCNNPKHKAYKNYGGRGITVGEEWILFSNFYRDMGDRPTPLHTLDRKDNEKGYYKENCRWDLSVVQNNNRRTNVRITFGNETHTLAEWARIKGLSINVLFERMKAGWSIEKSLTRPLSKSGIYHKLFRGYYHTPMGVFDSRTKAAAAENVDSNIIKQRCESKKEKWNNYIFIPVVKQETK